MLDRALLELIATQLMHHKEIVVADRVLPVQRTGSHRLRMLRFEMNGREYQAIEQNASKPSEWGKLARAGHEVVQFRDIDRNQYVAVAVDGKLKEYGKMKTK